MLGVFIFMDTKFCNQCQQTKPIADFIRSQPDSRTGRIYQFERKICISCVSQRQRARLLERFGDVEAVRKYKTLEKIRRICRRYHTTHEQVFQTLSTQNNQCKVCFRPISFFAKAYDDQACIDHNHKTGKVRGVLCHSCNTGLGYFYDNPAFLKSAIDYLG